VAFSPFAYANCQKPGYPWFRLSPPFLRYASERLRRYSYPCHEVQDMHVSAHVNKRILRSKISQHTARYAIPATFTLLYQKYRLLSETQRFYAVKNTEFFMLFFKILFTEFVLFFKVLQAEFVTFFKKIGLDPIIHSVRQ